MVVQWCSKSGTKNALGLGERGRELAVVGGCQ